MLSGVHWPYTCIPGFDLATGTVLAFIWHWRSMPTKTAEQCLEPSAFQAESHPPQRLATVKWTRLPLGFVSSMKVPVGFRSSKILTVRQFPQSGSTVLVVLCWKHSCLPFQSCQMICQNFFEAKLQSFFFPPWILNKYYKPKAKSRACVLWHSFFKN